MSPLIVRKIYQTLLSEFNCEMRLLYENVKLLYKLNMNYDLSTFQFTFLSIRYHYAGVEWGNGSSRGWSRNFYNKQIDRQIFKCLNYMILLYTMNRRIPSSLMSPSVSPNEFLATHLYDPKSLEATFLIFSIMYLLQPVSEATVSYFSPVGSISTMKYQPFCFVQIRRRCKNWTVKNERDSEGRNSYLILFHN